MRLKKQNYDCDILRFKSYDNGRIHGYNETSNNKVYWLDNYVIAGYYYSIKQAGFEKYHIIKIFHI